MGSQRRLERLHLARSLPRARWQPPGFIAPFYTLTSRRAWSGAGELRRPALLALSRREASVSLRLLLPEMRACDEQEPHACIRETRSVRCATELNSRVREKVFREWARPYVRLIRMHPRVATEARLASINVRHAVDIVPRRQ